MLKDKLENTKTEEDTSNKKRIYGKFQYFNRMDEN